MKYLSILFTWLLLSCGNNAKAPETSKQTDSIKNGKADQKAQIDSMQKIAFGKLKFGMSKKECDKIRERSIKIDGESYDISCSYYKNRLYQVNISSLSRDASYYDTDIKNYWRSLGQSIDSKYSDYNEVIDGFPNFLKMQASMCQASNIWTIGTKEIKLMVCETESMYYADVRINDTNMEASVKAEDQKTSDKSIKDASKNF